MQQKQPTPHTLQWPALTAECRPWTRWWWMGSAVDEAEITRHLESFHEAGIGGVEISPIYGVDGEERRAVDFLSPQWISMLRFTTREAGRLGMRVDMITGTGWPLGGPWVADEDAAARVVLETFPVVAGGRVTQPIISKSAPEATLQAVMAFPQDERQPLDLSQYVDAERRLDWSAPDGQWAIYALFQTGTGQQVKRAAPGGEGNVVDHYSGAAITRYLSRFDDAFSADRPVDDGTVPVRCFFNDSFEVYGANWTGDLLPEFARRRGYDLRGFLPALNGDADAQRVSRVRSDVRQTIADLVLEQFVQPWTAWAQRHGAQSRNQAHGSPGNLLDLYAAADIPETETFGTDWLELADLEPLPGTPPRYGGRAEVLACKLASSAAHIAAKPLCSAEAFTWLGEHGQTPLAHMKAEADLLFVMGINHVFFHGTPLSPVDAAWPGWLFYASTHVGPTNPFWRDLAALNGYIGRCQSFLQTSRPDNDLLVYLPIFDLWATEQHTEHLLHFLTPHNTEHWLDANLPDFTVAGRWLWDHGYGFDCVSDQLLEQAIEVEGGQFQSRGATYSALVIAGCTLMPPETIERILDLAHTGATVLVVGDLPADVPGLGDLDERRRRLRAALARLGPRKPAQSGIAEARVGEGRVLIGPDLEPLLQMAAIRRESAVAHGIEFIRRRVDAGYVYFMVNLGRQRVDQWVSLAVQAATVAIFDPAAERQGLARIRASDGPGTQVYLQLEPGESVLLRTFDHATDGPQWLYLSPAGQAREIGSEWHVEFVEGGPTLPEAATVGAPASWTEFPGDTAALRAFSGTARYSTTFRLPDDRVDVWELDLGSVCHSARVRLNGQELGTLYTRPFRMLLQSDLPAGEQRLEIEVTNLMANRLAEIDRQGQDWQRFLFVNTKYETFSAADWEPLPSGLLGPVRLTPLSRLLLDD